MKSIVILAALVVYIFFLFYYVFPQIATIREKGSNISLEMYYNGICEYTHLSRICNTIQWKTPNNQDKLKLAPETRVSSLGFEYNKYYNPMTTGPKELKKPVTKWTSGPEELVNYMNTVYAPKYENATEEDYKKRLIFQKRQYAGIPNQIMGVCDVLLLGLANDRLIQINAPGLPDHFFQFPFYNFTFPVTLPKDAEITRLSYSSDVSNGTVPLIDYVPRYFLPGRPSPLNLNDDYKNEVVINIGTPMTKTLFSMPRIQSFIKNTLQSSVNVSVFRATWHSHCFHSVFQPSEFIQPYLKPYLQFFEKHTMIGIQIRMKGNMTEWEERSFYMTRELVEAQFDTIEGLLNQDPKAAIYLASDSKSMEELVMNRFSKRVITAGKLPVMHTGRYTNEAGALRNFMDLYLLARCQTLFLTSKCSFSKLAFILNRNNPTVYYF